MIEIRHETRGHTGIVVFVRRNVVIYDKSAIPVELPVRLNTGFPVRDDLSGRARINKNAVIRTYSPERRY